MAKERVKRGGEPAERAYRCLTNNCRKKLRNRYFPEHYEEIHQLQTGRFECSSCNFMCSRQARCIIKHIKKAHKSDAATAIFNPFKCQEAPRIKGEHTDDCRREKLMAKVATKKARKVTARKTTAKRKGKVNNQVGNSSKDTTAQEIVADETGKKRKFRRNLGTEFEEPARKRRAKKDSNPTIDSPSTSSHDDTEEIKIEYEMFVSEELTDKEIEEIVVSDSESEDEDDNDDIPVNETVNVTTGNVVAAPEQNPVLAESYDEINEDDVENELADDTEVETEPENVNFQVRLPIEQVNNQNQEVDEANLTVAELTQRRMELEKNIRLTAYINSHNQYTERLYDNLLMDLISQFTANPQQSTTSLIQELTHRNPHVSFRDHLSCPFLMGSERSLDEVHECVIQSSEKLQVHFINYLIDSSEEFRFRLAEKIWKTLMTKTATYWIEAENGENEGLKWKVLELKCLSDAFKKANR